MPQGLLGTAGGDQMLGKGLSPPPGSLPVPPPLPPTLGPAECVLNLHKPLSVSTEGGALFPGPNLQPHLLFCSHYPWASGICPCRSVEAAGAGIAGDLMASASVPLVSRDLPKHPSHPHF